MVSYRFFLNVCYFYLNFEFQYSEFVPLTKKFNDPRLPDHVDKNTVFGNKTKTEFSAIDVIFPVNLFGEKFVEDEKNTELYKISHHAYGTGEQFKRKYNASFDPEYRYGIRLKWLPPGFWFKNSVKCKSENENEKKITEFIGKVLESEENNHCRYLCVDNRKGKFMGRSYRTAKDIMTGSDPDEREFEFNECLSAVNKTRLMVKKSKHDLRELRETFESLDKEHTGWLPLELVYEVSYQRGIRPAKQPFELALHSTNAINADHVRYGLFVELLDPNVQFSPRFRPRRKDGSEYFRKLDNYTPLRSVTEVHEKPFYPKTTVKTLLNPSIFSNYGLTFQDFHVGRSKDWMEKLFHAAGANLSRDTFNRVWDVACQSDCVDSQSASVEAFRHALREIDSRE